MKKRKVLLYTSDRVLLLFLLINNNSDECIYITTSNWKNLKKNIWNKLKGEKIVINEEKLEKKLMSRIFYIKEVRRNLKNLILKIKENKYMLYGLDQQYLGKRLFFKEDMIVIEEGFLNYSEKHYGNDTFKDFIRNMILKLFRIGERKEVLGFGDKIKKIYLTENLCKQIPKGLENKAKIINLKKLWDKKPKEEQNIILDVFDFNPEILKKVDENTVMLFTQPLSEDNIISEEEKIELYSKILKKYKNQSVIIKSHPREKTDYSIYFSNCYVMKEKYPVEILELVGINIKKAVTIFSSAAFGLGKNVEIDFYGTEIHPKLFERFGSQDKVMKRNVFLD